MIGRYLREISLAVVYALLLTVLAIFAPRFFQSSQFRDTCLEAAPILVAAVGMTLVILTRQIDISIGSQMSVCAVAAGLLAKAGLPMPLVVAATLAIGAALGAVNGLLVVGLNLPSIVVTLATMVIWQQGLNWWQQGQFVQNLPANFQWLGFGQSTGQWTIVGAALAIWGWQCWRLKYLTGGRAVYATGSDPEAARLAGIHPGRVVFGAFTAMGALAALAALLWAMQFPSVDPNLGRDRELAVIAAVVVGGVAITGGRGTLLGVLLGVLLLTTIRPAVSFLGAGSHWEKAIFGIVLLAAVASEALQDRQRRG